MGLCKKQKLTSSASQPLGMSKKRKLTDKKYSGQSKRPEHGGDGVEALKQKRDSRSKDISTSTGRQCPAKATKSNMNFDCSYIEKKTAEPGETYPCSYLDDYHNDHAGVFKHNQARLVQQRLYDQNGSFIAPWQMWD